MKIFKKLLCATLIFASLTTPTFAWTDISTSAYEGSAHSFDYVHISTTDYYSSNGISYLPLSFLRLIVNRVNGLPDNVEPADFDIYETISYDYNQYSGDITIHNGFWISSSKEFTAYLKLNDMQCHKLNTASNTIEDITTVASPKLINGKVFIPARTIAELFSYGKYNYDPVTKAISFKISMGG